VTGDGTATVADLVRIAQQTPESRRRARDRGHLLLSLDDEALQLLAEEGLGPDSVPGQNRFVALRRRANVSSGGTTADALPRLHPDNAALAVTATRALRLDIAGVDLITPDIGTSWLDAGGAICEVNAQPQISPEFVPDIYRNLLRNLFPRGSRIPSFLLIGSRERLELLHQVARDLAFRLSTAGVKAAWHRGGELWIADNQYARVGSGFAERGFCLMAHPEAEAAILVATHSEILADGLPVPKLDAVMMLDSGTTVKTLESEVWSMIRQAVGEGLVLLQQGSRKRLERSLDGLDHSQLKVFDDVVGDAEPLPGDVVGILASHAEKLLETADFQNDWLGGS
jgi:cyanophycin synthetase